VFWGSFVPALYLSLMDIVALKETTWSISPTQTTGILFFGILPLEEVLFFFITNVLITFGLTLLLADVSRERFADIKKQIQAYPARGRRRKERRAVDLQSR
ncbi:MAG: lycopene cyclase domain-containing protein, partial [Chloroflexi bacterium]